MKNIILIVISVLFNSSAQLSLKKGMMAIGEIGGGAAFLTEIPQMIKNGFLWMGMGFYGISIALWLVVLSRVDVSYAYPFLSIGYIVSAIVGYCIFQESITPIRVVGIVVICLGVILISRS